MQGGVGGGRGDAQRFSSPDGQCVSPSPQLRGHRDCCMMDVVKKALKCLFFTIKPNETVCATSKSMLD